MHEIVPAVSTDTNFRHAAFSKQGNFAWFESCWLFSM